MVWKRSPGSSLRRGCNPTQITVTLCSGVSVGTMTHYLWQTGYLFIYFYLLQTNYSCIDLLTDFMAETNRSHPLGRTRRPRSALVPRSAARAATAHRWLECSYQTAGARLTPGARCGSVSALSRHRRQHVYCAGMGVPVLKMTASACKDACMHV